MKTITGVQNKLLNVSGFVMLVLLSLTTAKIAQANPSPLDTFDTGVSCYTRYWVPETNAYQVYGPGYYARLSCPEERTMIKEHHCYKHKVHKHKKKCVCHRK